MALPSRGEVFSKLLHHVREAQDQAAMMSHLHNTEDNAADKAAARGWFIVSEQLKKFVYTVTEMAKRGFQ